MPRDDLPSYMRCETCIYAVQRVFMDYMICDNEYSIRYQDEVHEDDGCIEHEER